MMANRTSRCVSCGICQFTAHGAFFPTEALGRRCAVGCTNVRPHLLRVLEAHRRSEDVHIFLPGASGPRSTAHYAAMRESVFCLMPGGDGITRNAFYQSLLMGCIPVVFRSDPVYFAQYAFSRVIPYADMVHHVPERAVLSGLDVVQELRSAREDVIRAKQALIANWSHLLTFRQSALSETLSELQGMRGGAAATATLTQAPPYPDLRSHVACCCRFRFATPDSGPGVSSEPTARGLWTSWYTVGISASPSFFDGLCVL